MSRHVQPVGQSGFQTSWWARPTQAMGWWFFGWVLKYWCGFRVEGQAALQGIGQCIFAPTHASHLDFWAVLRGAPPALRRKTYVAAAKDHFYARPLRRWITRLFSYHNFPIDRGQASHTEYRRLCRLLESGQSLLMFAQGTRTRDGGAMPFKPMLAMLAVDCGVPIVPVAVLGTFEAMPAGRFWPRRHPVCVRFGTPLWFEKSGEPKKLSKTAKKVNNDLMQSIQRLITDKPEGI